MVFEDYLYPLLGSYFASPQWVKSSVGRMYSLFSTSLGRSPSYISFLAEAAIRDENELKQLTSRKLGATLRLALESVPAYQQYRHLQSRLDSPLEVLRELPLISKEDIKRDLAQFLSMDTSQSLRLKTATGGSTSTPMVFYLHKGVSRTKEYAFMESFHQYAGLTRSDVVLALRGRTVPSARRPGGALWMYEPIKRQLILSSDHLERRYMAEYIAAIRLWKPRYIQAYPSTIYPLARWLKEHPAPDISERIKGVMLFSENVFDHHMALLKEVFPCQVLKHYGHSERVLMAASMPDDDRCFFWPQYGHFELIDDAGKPITKPGILGEIVGTSFDNQVMPFVRYRTGDMAVLGDKPHPLLPGFPVVERIEGRRQEFLVCRDNRLIAVCGMGAAHSADLAAVDSMQFEQSRPGHFLIKVATTQPLSVEAKCRIVHAMEAKTQGGCTAEVVEVKEIPRTLRGKHRLLVQHLDIGNYLGAPVIL
jgi:phenylacetate-CoA ligase